MIGLIIVAHGNLGHELLAAAEIIAGEQDSVATIGLHPEDAISDLPRRILEAKAGLSDTNAVLVLVDLFGGSPGNTAMRCLADDHSFELLSGVNLPMLLEVLMGRDTMSMEELVATAIEAGQTGIRDLGAILRQATIQQGSPATCTTPSEGE